MTADEFRAAALALAGASEGSHQAHADFRLGGRVFATLGPDETWGMVRLPPSAQARWTAELPEVFEAFPGSWGRAGATRIALARAEPGPVRQALAEAWSALDPEEG